MKRIPISAAISEVEARRGSLSIVPLEKNFGEAARTLAWDSVTFKYNIAVYIIDS